MNIVRRDLEEAIEILIALFDQIDGDPDFEPEPLEEQHDREAELTWTSDEIPRFYVIAERARVRRGRLVEQIADRSNAVGCFVRSMLSSVRFDPKTAR